jgi:hypothetical protein
MINDMRSYEIQQIDYKDRFRVFNALGEKIKNNSLIQKILEEFNSINGFNNKMKYLYSLHMDEDIAKCVLNNIYDTNYAKYYWTIPANRAGTLAYIQKNLEKEFENINREKSDNVENRVKEKVIQTFQINLKYTKSDIKETLRSIYESLNYNKTPKASDLENYFELKDCKLTNSSGKQDHGFKIIKIKD